MGLVSAYVPLQCITEGVSKEGQASMKSHEIELSILKHFALSPQLFSKTTETTNRIFKTLSPYDKLEIYANPSAEPQKYPKKHDYLQLEPLGNSDGEAKRLRIQACLATGSLQEVNGGG